MRTERWGGLDCRIAGGEDRRGGGDGPIAVLLHGFGAPGDDLVPLAPELAVPRSVRFVFPEAPIDLGGGRAWWMIDMERLQRDAMAGRPREIQERAPEGMAEARERVAALLVQVTQQLGAAPLVLGGFSQGAMLSCDVALRTPPAQLPLAGLVLLSGTFLVPSEWTPLMPARAGLPVLMSHGRQDPLLPFAHAERLRDAWKAAGAELEWIEFRGGHEIPRNVVDGVSKLVTRAGATR